MDSVEMITGSVYFFRPWLLAQAPLTVEQVYQNASEMINDATGGSMVS